MEDIKFCINCNYYVHTTRGNGQDGTERTARCTHPIVSPSFDLVAGDRYLKRCDNERSLHAGVCGIEAKCFEEKIHWYNRLFKKD